MHTVNKESLNKLPLCLLRHFCGLYFKVWICDLKSYHFKNDAIVGYNSVISLKIFLQCRDNTLKFSRFYVITQSAQELRLGNLQLDAFFVSVLTVSVSKLDSDMI